MTRRAFCALLLVVAGALEADTDDDGVRPGPARAGPFSVRTMSRPCAGVRVNMLDVEL